VSGAGDHRSARDGAGDLHDHQTATALPPRLTCTHAASRSEAGVPSEEEQTLGMAGAAGCSSAMSGQGCDGSARCGEALGRHLRWVVGGCWSGVLGHGGCGIAAKDLMGRSRPVWRGRHYCGDR
jgi:hypothetical protein